ncbi:RNA polymerase sigma factor [Ruminococcus flavefaciens]|uniref:RNA polymerase sigma factor n=1 Tax=Ruminococcus flavefaciens TaxID=1265 RepID=UPI0013DADA63|nr:sigma-70 family RNA polymerase sigma factor [Ruminococcus flavefaciens]
MNENDIKRMMKESPEEGFRALFDEYWSYAYTIVYSILRGMGSRNDVEDCTAEVLSDVMMKYDALRDTSLKAYIGTSAKRRAIDFRRSINTHTSRNIPLEAETEYTLPSGDDIEAGAESSDISAILLSKIEELGEPDSSIIIQKYFYDRSSSETARILGMNPITVRSRLRRALKKLKATLTDMDITL